MTIYTTPDMSGLRSAIANIGTILGNALDRRHERQKLTQASQKLKNAFPADSILGKIISDPDIVSAFSNNKFLSSIIAPLVKEEARSSGMQQYEKNIFDRESSNAPNISGVPNQPTGDDISARTPREQEEYQQPGVNESVIEPPSSEIKGLESIGINPPTHHGKPITNEIINQYANSRYEEHRNVAKVLENQKREYEKFLSKRLLEKENRAFKENSPYLEHLSATRQTLPTQQAALFRIRDALASGNVKNLQNFIADYTGNEYLRSAPLNQLGSATKEIFVSGIKGIPGVRLNQLIEKNLQQALQTGGKDAASNAKISEFQQFSFDILEKELEISDKLIDAYEKKGLEPPRGLERKVQEQLKPYINKKQKDLVQTYRDIDDGKITSKGEFALREAKIRIKNQPPPRGTIWMMSPNGDIVAIPKNEINEAKKNNARLIK